MRCVTTSRACDRTTESGSQILENQALKMDEYSTPVRIKKIISAIKDQIKYNKLGRFFFFTT